MLDYPLKFKPIFKEKIWGGNKLKNILNKKPDGNQAGESWEISGVEHNISVVSTGKLRGQSLSELIVHYKDELIGKKNYTRFGNQFPLLIKFIDANADLSIQVHPDDALAKKRHNSFGKTEMWYIMDAKKDAELILGFNQKITLSQYKAIVADGKIEEYLNHKKVKAGEAFFIKAGLIHAIGAGVLLAEIQQTSDITYRIYDWNRVDSNGNQRELHTDLAADAVDYDLIAKRLEKKNEKLASCPYFKVNELTITSKKHRDLSIIDSFVIYMAVEGRAEITCRNNKTTLHKGETVLIPAAVSEVELCGEGKVLEIYV